MKATEKIKLMMRLEKNFKKLDFEELHMIRDTLNKEIENKLADDDDIEISASDRENGFFTPWIQFTLSWIFLFQLVTQAYTFSVK